MIVGELHVLPHLPELPARGIGADLIGRAGALLVDIGIDTVPRGYRIAQGRSSTLRRAVSLLAEDLDALEEEWEKAGLRDSGRTVKVQAPGPITLAANLELGGGHRAITDPGALRDLAESLIEGLSVHQAALSRRLGAPVVVQLDEPSLPAALAGRLSGVTGMSTVHPVDEAVTAALLDDCAKRLGSVAIHVCAADVPWKLLLRTGIEAISMDASTLVPADLDGIGEWVESGRTALLGVAPAIDPARPLQVREVAKAAAAITDRLGFSRTILRERVGLTPSCGLAGATPEWARTVVELVQRAVDGIAEDPDSV